LGATMKQSQGSWLALVTFCAVTAFTAALGFGLLFATGSVAFAGPQSSQTSDETEAGSATRISLASAESVSPDQSPEMSPVKLDATVPGKLFSGVITDSRCSARHSMNSGKTSAECARSCIRNGANYLLVDGDVTHALQGEANQLEKLAGERVDIVGMLEGNTIKVASVVAR
jgi:hypothetical protein